MARQRFSVLAWMLTVVGLGLGSSAACAAGEGHGGGGGHEVGGSRSGFRGGFRGYGFRGYGYPGWYGFGLGCGLGYGWEFGYPYYPYPYPYAAGYPVYVDVGSGPPATAYPPPGPVAAQGYAPVAAGSPVPTGPVRLTDTDMLLSIRVPPDAIVRVNGEQTAQSGPRREFMSSGLAPGRSYTFVVTAHWAGTNGQTVDLERHISVQGGERRNVDFLISPPPEPLAFPRVESAGR